MSPKPVFVVLILVSNLLTAFSHFHWHFGRHHRPSSASSAVQKVLKIPNFELFTVPSSVNEIPKIFIRFEGQEETCRFTKQSFLSKPDDFCHTESLIIRENSGFWCIGFFSSDVGPHRLKVTLDRAFRFETSASVRYSQKGTFNLEFQFRSGIVSFVKILARHEGLTSLEDISLNGQQICLFQPISEPEEKPILKPQEKPILKPDDKLIFKPDEKPVWKPKEKPICGLRRAHHQNLISHGKEARSGDWPWHVALYHLQGDHLRYRCGGALVSDSAVLTAAHCLLEGGRRVVEERVKLHLGKTKLSHFDENSREVDVFKILLHPEFNTETTQHDIALLKLSTVVEFSSHIQPVCLTFSDFSIDNLQGSVVGWGRTETGTLATTLRHAKMRVVPKLECLESNRDFYGAFLYDGNFCAGYRNASSACSGDSGGGMYFFVNGHWILRGLVSIGMRVDAAENGCDNGNFVLFTDVQRHMNWIAESLKMS